MAIITSYASSFLLKNIGSINAEKREEDYIISTFIKEILIEIEDNDRMLDLTNKEVIALGGISQNNVRKLKLTLCKGFAGISFFEKKGP